MRRTRPGIAWTALVVLAVGGLCARTPRVRGQAPTSTSPALDSAIAGSTNEVHEIKVTAKKYEFDPNPITVKKGEHVRLLITALDHDHGFKIEEFNINQLIKKGTTAKIDLTPEKTGTFNFHCSHFCGMGHCKMHGELLLEV